MTLQEFADKHGLVIEIRERIGWWNPNLGDSGKYYCHFKRAEIKDGNFLTGVCGNGITRQTAMDDYARKLSGKILVVNAMSKMRKEIRIPKLLKGGIKQ